MKFLQFLNLSQRLIENTDLKDMKKRKQNND